MIPPFDPATGNLPPGAHEATWAEFVARYGSTPYRLTLLAGMKAALDALQLAGCPRVYIDGGFVTARVEPGDFDGGWETAGVGFTELTSLAPELFDFRAGRAAQKAKYGGEFFPADMPAEPAGTIFLASSSVTSTLVNRKVSS